MGGQGGPEIKLMLGDGGYGWFVGGAQVPSAWGCDSLIKHLWVHVHHCVYLKDPLVPAETT